MESTSQSPVKLTLNDYHTNTAKAKMVEHNGFLMPYEYEKTGYEQEMLYTRTNATLADLSYYLHLRVSGAKAAEFLKLATNANVDDFKENTANLAMILTEEGFLLDKAFITKFPDYYHLTLGPTSNQQVLSHFQQIREKRFNGEDLVFSDDYDCLIVSGPRSGEVVKNAINPEIAELKFMEHRKIGEEVVGVPFSVYKGCGNGEEVFDFSVEKKYTEKLWELLSKNEEVKLMGFKGWETLRMEVGYYDLRPEEIGKYTPEELGMGWLVQFALKDRDPATLNFIGYEALSKKPEPKTKRIGFEIEGQEAIEKGAKLTTEGKELGVVTHVSYSPHLKKTVGVALATDLSLPLDKETFVGEKQVKVLQKIQFMPPNYPKWAILIVWINFLKIRIQHLSTLLHFILISIAKKLTSTPTTMRIISLYNNLLMKHPLKTKIITAGLTFAAGDITCQLFIEKDKEGKPPKFDWYRVFRMTAAGSFILTPFLHIWYTTGVTKFMQLLPKLSPTAKVFTAMAFDQTAITIPISYILILGIEYMEIPNFIRAHQNTINILPEVLINNWLFWPLVMQINFSLVPPHYRVLFSNVLGYFWNIYLSYAANKDISIPNSILN